MARHENLPRDFPVTVKGYSRIHAWLFHNIYDWAGQNRFVDTGRAGSPFCRAQFIAPEMAKRFDAIHAENSLRGSHRDAFAARAGEHACELNAIHPFLDGNGRTLRGFLETLALQAGMNLILRGSARMSGTGLPLSAFSALTTGRCAM